TLFRSDVDHRHLASTGGELGSAHGRPERLARHRVAQELEWPVDGLYQQAIASGEHRRDDLHDLREACSPHDVGVADERMEVLRAYQRILDVVEFFQQRRGFRPPTIAPHLPIPDVPLVEGDMDMMA